MSESREDEDRSAEGVKDPTSGAGPGAEEPAEFGAGKGPAEADTEGEPDTEPGSGGYAGRDPKSDMPSIPSVPESQEDPHSHDAAPPEDSPEPPASN